MFEYQLKGKYNIIRKYGNITVCIQMFQEVKNIFYEISGLEHIIGYDLEINLSLEPSEIERLLPVIISKVLEKEIKLVDDLITTELTGAPVQVKILTPKTDLGVNKKVARLIFSDERFLLPHDKDCNEVYKLQLS